MKLQYTMFPLKHSLLFNLKPIFIQYLSGTIKKKKKKKVKKSQQTIEPRSTLNNSSVPPQTSSNNLANANRT